MCANRKLIFLCPPPKKSTVHTHLLKQAAVMVSQRWAYDILIKLWSKFMWSICCLQNSSRRKAEVGWCLSNDRMLLCKRFSFRVVTKPPKEDDIPWQWHFVYTGYLLLKWTLLLAVSERHSVDKHISYVCTYLENIIRYLMP